MMTRKAKRDDLSLAAIKFIVRAGEILPQIEHGINTDFLSADCADFRRLIFLYFNLC
jgi:hypothetical protein